MKKLLTIAAMLVMGLSSTFVSAQSTTAKQTRATTQTVKTKKDGTPDLRYKANTSTTTKVVAGPAKKDGTPDMRYKANKTTVTKTTKKKPQ